MTRTKLVLITLALALVGAGCDAADALGPADATMATDSLDVLLSQTSGETAAQRAGGGGVPLFDALAAEITGFGGLYRRGQCSVVVVLTADADRAEALPIVQRVLTPLVARSCGDRLALHAQEGQYTYRALIGYLQAARPLGTVDGVVAVFIDYQANRLVVRVTRRRLANAIAERLPGLGIPVAAVVFQVVAGG